MNQLAPIGHNAPPSPIDAVISQYDGVICEAQNWADGEPVTDEAGMKAVDNVLKQFKTYRADLVNAGKEQTDPLHKAWKAEVAAVKVYTDDADMMQSALVACVAPFKARLAAEKAEADRKAQAEAWEASRKAREAAAAVNAADIEQQRAAAAAMADAEAKQRAANAAAKDTVKGMRTVTHYSIEDDRAALHWIAKNDKPTMADFIAEYVRRNHKTATIDGVKVWQTKEAF
jgi:hypothetical protein